MGFQPFRWCQARVADAYLLPATVAQALLPTGAQLSEAYFAGAALAVAIAAGGGGTSFCSFSYSTLSESTFAWAAVALAGASAACCWTLGMSASALGGHLLQEVELLGEVGGFHLLAMDGGFDRRDLGDGRLQGGGGLGGGRLGRATSGAIASRAVLALVAAWASSGLLFSLSAAAMAFMACSTSG